MQVHSIIKWTLLVILGIMLTGCYFDNEEELYGNMPCEVIDVTYDGSIKAIIDTQCAVSGCHVSGGSGNGIFESYANVKSKVDNGSFRKRVLEDRNMPPNRTLSDCQIQLIQNWLDNGAPQ